MLDKFIENDLERILAASLVHRDYADLEKISAHYSKCKDKDLFFFAQEHEVASIVGERLLSLGKANEQWKQAIEEMKYKMQGRMEALDEMGEALSKAGIDLIALKNAGIARGIYPYLSESPMGDIDVLVKKSDFVRAHEILLQLGYEPDFRVKDTIEELGVEAALLSGGAEYRKDLGEEILWCELQWRPIAGRWIAPELEPKAEDLFDRALSIEGSAVKILSPEDNLVQVCLHTAKHSYVRAPGLRLHTDVDRIVRCYEAGDGIDWDLFLKLVQAVRAEVAVYFSLLLAVEILNTPIPQNLLLALKPSKVREKRIFSMIKKAGIFHPLAPKFSRLEYLKFTALLFDDLGVGFKSAFPSPAYMQSQYGLKSKRDLPFLYAKRFFSLLTKRVKT